MALFKGMKPEKAQLLGHLMADGFVSNRGKYRFGYYGNKTECKNFVKLFRKVYSKSLLKTSWGYEMVIKLQIWRNYYNKNGKKKQLFAIRLSNKKICKDLWQYGSFYSGKWRIPNEIMNGNKKVKRAFLDAFIIDEGYRYSKNMVAVSSSNKEGLLQLQKIANEFNEKTRIGTIYNKVYKKKLYNLYLYEKVLEPKGEDIHFRLTSNLKKRVELVIRGLSLTKSEYFRKLILKDLERHK